MRWSENVDPRGLSSIGHGRHGDIHKQFASRFTLPDSSKLLDDTRLVKCAEAASTPIKSIAVAESIPGGNGKQHSVARDR